MEKAERVLGKVETALNPTEGSKPPETITDEERFMFRKLGLRLKAFLLLGISFSLIFCLFVGLLHTYLGKEQQAQDDHMPYCIFVSLLASSSQLSIFFYLSNQIMN